MERGYFSLYPDTGTAFRVSPVTAVCTVPAVKSRTRLAKSPSYPSGSRALITTSAPYSVSRTTPSHTGISWVIFPRRL